jgi:hypothetical protein
MSAHSTWKLACVCAISGGVPRRSLYVALVVGTVLNLINQGDALLGTALAAGLGKAPDSAPVLATPLGEYQSPDAVSHAWARAVPEITFHSLRHTHASMLIASGMDILTISRRLGHASPAITLNVYGHLVHGSDDRAAQIVDAAFGNGSNSVAGPSKRPQITG